MHCTWACSQIMVLKTFRSIFHGFCSGTHFLLSLFFSECCVSLCIWELFNSIYNFMLWKAACSWEDSTTRKMHWYVLNQGAKKVIFTTCHSGKLKLTFTSPNIISTSPKNVLTSRLISQFFCNLNSSKNFTCPSGKLITEFTSPIAKSNCPRLLDTTFFTRC